MFAKFLREYDLQTIKSSLNKIAGELFVALDVPLVWGAAIIDPSKLLTVSIDRKRSKRKLTLSRYPQRN
jgi:hypothetical protein